MPWPGEPWEGSCSRTGPKAHRLAHTVNGTPDRLRVGVFRVAWSDALGTTTRYIASALRVEIALSSNWSDCRTSWNSSRPGAQSLAG